MTEILKLPQYQVFVGNCLENLGEFLSRYSQKKVIVLTDINSHNYCLPKISPSLPVHFLEITISDGEVHKELNTCQIIWEKLLTFGVNRNDLVINLGGGVIGDMGGFCASTFKRGIDFIQIPTTLLSMVDASIGGKLGIDFNGVKNSIGVFKDPKAVFVDPSFLKTLSWRELRSGFAEIIKHALISDVSLWNEIRQIDIQKQEDWQSFISDSLKVKQQIVIEDPFEKGRRKALNFGHTIGHSVEGVMLHKANFLLHGEAIAIGMVVESWLAVQKGLMSNDLFSEIFAFLKNTYDFLPLELPLINDFILLMKNDKKNESEGIHFSTIGQIGEVHHDLIFDASSIKTAFERFNHLLNL